MPVESCRSGGKPGFRAGPTQKCFSYTAGNASARTRARKRARAQFVAIGLSQQRRGAPSELGKAIGLRALGQLSEVFDARFWDELRAVMMRRLLPMFREAFLVGAVLGSGQRPVRAQRPPLPAGVAFRAILDAHVRTHVIAVKQDIGAPAGKPELPFDFEAVVAASDDVIEAYADSWWRNFRRSTQDGLRAAIRRADANGLGIQSVIADIEPLFGTVRATRIAVSETTTLIGQGAQETYRRAGFGEWEWRTVRDARVDPICDALDKKRFPMSTAFQRAHPHCRCFPVPAGKPSVGLAPPITRPVGLSFPSIFAA